MRALRDREEAISALEKARKSPDAEVRRLATEILASLERKRARHRLARAKALGEGGRAVEAADRLAYSTKCYIADEGWDGLTHFADRVIDNTARHFPFKGLRQNPDFPRGDFRHFAERFRLKEVAAPKIEIDTGDEHFQGKIAAASARILEGTHGRLFLRGEEISWRSTEAALGMNTGILAASGDVHLVSASDSVLVVGGNLQLGSFHRTLIVCDGDVELLLSPADRGLIIARGKVTCLRGTFAKCMIRSEDFLLYPDGKKIIIKNGIPDPLGFVKFFELSDVGLVATDPDAHEKAVASGVRLNDVRKGSPFASGLRAGDVVTALDGTKVTSTEDFRRLLRRKLGQGGPIITFTVRRTKETLDVAIPVKD